MKEVVFNFYVYTEFLKKIFNIFMNEMVLKYNLNSVLYIYMQTSNGVLTILLSWSKITGNWFFFLQKDQHYGQHDTDAGGVQ